MNTHFCASNAVARKYMRKKYGDVVLSIFSSLYVLTFLFYLSFRLILRSTRLYKIYSIINYTFIYRHGVNRCPRACNRVKVPRVVVLGAIVQIGISTSQPEGTLLGRLEAVKRNSQFIQNREPPVILFLQSSDFGFRIN